MGMKGSGVIDRVKAELIAAFSMVDMGPISFYLGLKVERDQENEPIKLSQPAYIKKILSKFRQPVQHSDERIGNSSTPNRRRSPAAEIERYQRMTRSLMFSMIETRPDIAFSPVAS